LPTKCASLIHGAAPRKIFKPTPNLRKLGVEIVQRVPPSLPLFGDSIAILPLTLCQLDHLVFAGLATFRCAIGDFLDSDEPLRLLGGAYFQC
jgi:hypothetical protein